MSLSKSFTREEPIAGLEISEEAIRLAYILPAQKTDKKTKISLLAEEPLASGVIIGGMVKDGASLTAALKKISIKAKKTVNYFVVSIPSDASYYKIFSFPKTITGQKLEEAMKLAIKFQLPFKEDGAFVDWEKQEDGGKRNEIALSAIKKSVVNEYLKSFGEAKMNVVAIETHPQSFARSCDFSERTVLVSKENPSSFLLSIISGKGVRLTRTIPKEFLKETELQNEIKRVSNFYNAGNDPIAESISFEQSHANENLFEKDDTINKHKIALGAGLRAIVPRKEDAMISLMPLGTETAYEYQRMAAFSSFTTHLIIGLSIFFSVSYIASFALLVAVQQDFTKRISGLSAIPVQNEVTDAEHRATKLNDLTAKLSPLVLRFPKWSKLVEEISAKIPQTGIIINSLSISSPEEKITMSGKAKDRATLSNFRKTLLAATDINNVDFPIQNLEQKENISFQISFNVKNPETFYDWNK